MLSTYLHKICFRVNNFRVNNVAEAYSEFWWGNLRERHHLGDPDIDGRIILNGC
jgi:hypothetical protein